LQKYGIAGYKFGPFIDVDWKDEDEVRIAIDLFGCVMVGVQLPKGWELSKLWDVTSDKTVGGHAILGSGHDIDQGHSQRGIKIESWGSEDYLLTWAAAAKYCDEMQAVLSPAWISDNNLAPSGFDITQLTDDLAEVQSV
jgi:hypothetical protein